MTCTYPIHIILGNGVSIVWRRDYNLCGGCSRGLGRENWEKRNGNFLLLPIALLPSFALSPSDLHSDPSSLSLMCLLRRLEARQLVVKLAILILSEL